MFNKTIRSQSASTNLEIFIERINFVSTRQSSPKFLSSLIIKYIAKGYDNKSFPKLIIKYLSTTIMPDQYPLLGG